MNTFSPYIDLQKELHSRYGSLYKEFPYSGAVLDLAIRHCMTDREEGARRVLGRILAGRRFRQLYFTYCRFLSRFRTRDSVVVLALSERFPGLHDLLEGIYDERGYLVACSGGDRPREWVDYLVLRRVAPFRLCFHSQGVSEAINAILQGQNLKQRLTDPELWRRLETALEAEAARIWPILRNLDVRLVISGGDFMPEARWLSILLREMGSQHVVFAHAFLTHVNGIGFCPVVADRLFVWSARQRDEIRKVLSPEEGQKVVYAGWPKVLSLPNNVERSNGALLILEKIRPYPHPDLKEGILELISRMAGVFDAMSVRFHPDDSENPELLATVRRVGGKIAQGNLYEELTAAELVIGTNSSALFEAGQLGLPVVQIEEYARVPCEHAVRLRIPEIEQARKLYGRLRPAVATGARREGLLRDLARCLP